MNLKNQIQKESHTFAVGHNQGERGQGEGLFCTCVGFGGIVVASPGMRVENLFYVGTIHRNL